jgi:hypothetical protein
MAARTATDICVRTSAMDGTRNLLKNGMKLKSGS